jgi:hypothetical protein
MLSEQVKQLLDAPQNSPVQQGVDSYPRVIDQSHAGENHMLVTFAVPGLRRVKVWTPVATWVAGGHLDCHDAMMAQRQRLLPPLAVSEDDDIPS